VNHLDSWEVVKRYKITALPTADVIINYLHELYSSDYDLDNKAPREEPLECKIGEQILGDDALEDQIDLDVS